MANNGKPGPDRGEETDLERPSPLQTTTGGNLADTEGEGDATFALPPSNTPPPQPKSQRDGKKRGWMRERESGNSSMSASEGEDRRGRETKDYWWKMKGSSNKQKDEDQIRKLEKQLEEQRLEHNEEMKKKDEELEKRLKDIRGATAVVPPTKVVEIDQWNKEQVSLEHNGMIMKEDGSLVRTPQYETFLKNMDTQLKRSYGTTPTMPEELGKIPDHPQPTDMNLGWSHRGEWQETPVDPSQEGSEQEECRVARVEPYIDTDGVIKRALSYGDDADHLSIWFSLEEVQKAYPKWRIANPSKFFNNKKFSKTARRDLQENKRDRKRGNLPPGDQSTKDIQGGRGGWRGRGSWRRGYQPYNRGRGRPTYNSESRRDREYREWDEGQDVKQGPSQSYEQGMWDYYEDQMGYKKKGVERDSQGYYTKDYEDRKRARSPSSRGERPSRDDRAYERRTHSHSQDRRRESNLERREYSPDRREHSPERRSRRDYSPGQGSDRRRERSRRDYTPDKGRRYSGQER